MAFPVSFALKFIYVVRLEDGISWRMCCKGKFVFILSCTAVPHS
uniref:Uncharacterized protein n=1 Tax=Rhizophora mucronata TaxID=61149 RepID=A0A2P2NBC8_RHIMU